MDRSQICRVGSKKSVMTWVLWGVALLSCKVWHLVPWLAEHVGWGGTQSHPCSVGQLGSPEWRRVAFYHCSILPLRWIYADPHYYWSASIAISLLNSVSNEAFSEPKIDGEAGDWSVKGSWTTIAWSRAHGMDTTLHGCGSLSESREFWLHAAFFGPKKFMPPHPDQTWKVLT